MADERDSEREPVTAAMRRINQAWLDGRVDDLTPLVHEDIVVVVPGFAARGYGRDACLAGFRDFCTSARIADFRELDHEVDVVGSTAAVTFRYEMVYERLGERYRATGRDLWIFQHSGAEWIAVWRAMLEMNEQPA